MNVPALYRQKITQNLSPVTVLVRFSVYPDKAALSLPPGKEAGKGNHWLRCPFATHTPEG